MTEKLPCHIVQDLLPQYAEKLLTPESEREVKNHLDECTSCREIYKQLTDPEPIVAEDDFEFNYLKKVHRSKTRLLLGAAAALIFITAGILLFFNAKARKAVVNYDEASKTIVVYGKETDTQLTLPDTVQQAQNLDAQYESFHVSAELSLLRTDDQPLDEYLSAYLNRTNQSLQFLRTYLKENCKDQYPAERAAKYVDISILSDGDYSWSELEDRISLEIGRYYWHREELYLLTLLGSHHVEWKQLGYAWYLGSCIDPYGEVLAITSMENMDKRYAAIYTRAGGTKEPTPENYRLLNDAVSCLCLTQGMNWGTPYESMPLKNTTLYRGPKKSIDPGNEMSVCMATSFIAYLSDQYGFEKVSRFCFGQGGFKETFQTDYESAYNAWAEHILTVYGDPSSLSS